MLIIHSHYTPLSTSYRYDFFDYLESYEAGRDFIVDIAQGLNEGYANALQFDETFNPDLLTEDSESNRQALLYRYRATHDNISRGFRVFTDAVKHPGRIVFSVGINLGENIFNTVQSSIYDPYTMSRKFTYDSIRTGVVLSGVGLTVRYGIATSRLYKIQNPFLIETSFSTLELNVGNIKSFGFQSPIVKRNWLEVGVHGNYSAFTSRLMQLLEGIKGLYYETKGI